ncbi:MAG: hypothetical protein ACKVKZ_02765 [Alphaproteobacteria bacterium]
MVQLKHPISNVIFTVISKGLCEVDDNNVKGIFDGEGRHVSGELKYADPEMLVWLAGPQLPDEEGEGNNG